MSPAAARIAARIAARMAARLAAAWRRLRRGGLHARLERAEALAAARQRYVAHLGHELRNLVGSIVATLALAEHPHGAAALPRIQRALRANALALKDLLDASLDEAQLDAGSFAIRPSCVDLAALLASLASEVAPLAHGGDSVFIGIEGELALTTCWRVDGVRLAQIVRNLVANALRHAPGADVRVRARVLADEGPTRRHLCVQVIDRGPGLTAAQQQRLFGEFARVGDVPAVGSTGLGLAISRRLARAMGGDLRVCSAPGLGSTFSLWLPVQPPAAGEFSHFHHERGGGVHAP